MDGRGRREDMRLLAGAGEFAADYAVPGLLIAGFLRSDRAAGVVRAMDIRAALRIPGAIAVLTPADLERDGIGLIEALPLPRDDGARGFAPPRPLLCSRFMSVGEPLAMVVATTSEALRDGVEAIAVDIDDEPAVTTPAQSLNADPIWPGATDNIAYLRRFGDADGVTRAFEGADRVTRLSLSISRVTAVTLEPRTALALPEADGLLDLVTATQGPGALRTALAGALRIAPERLRIRSGDIGGSFGMKNGLYREDALVAWAALRLDRPVRWVADRTESFLSDDMARDVHATAALGLDCEGRFLALEARMMVNVGAYASRRSLGMTGNIFGLAGPYDIPAIWAESQGVFTHTGVIAPYRGNGRPEATYVLERLIDAAAAETGIDPLDLRRRNLVTPDRMPFRSALGATYDCGNFPATLAKAAVLANHAGHGERRSAARALGLLRGIGLAMPLEIAGGPGKAPRPDSAVVRVSTDGAVHIATGAVSSGQGHETVMPTLVAAVLGIAPSSIAYVQADTDEISDGRGAGGSGGAAVSVAAMVEAAQMARTRLVSRAADMLGADPNEVELDDGLARQSGTNRTLTLGEVAAAEGEEGITVRHRFTPAGATWPNGCHIAEVEIDPETGQVTLVGYTAVEDVGTVLSPALVDGQLHGGIAQGVAQALAETAVIDPDGPVADRQPDGLCSAAQRRPADCSGWHRCQWPTQANSPGCQGRGRSGDSGRAGGGDERGQ